MHYHDKLLLLLVLDTEVPFINEKISHFFPKDESLQILMI